MRDSYTLYEDKLKGEYKEVFGQIDTYFGTEKVDEDTREEYMGDLLDIFLLAQEEGKPVEKITGKNIESFCKSFCSNLTWQQKVLNVLDRLKSLMWITLLMSLIELFFAFEDIINGTIDVFALRGSFNVLGYIIGFAIIIIVSAITDAITKKIMFKMKRLSVIIWEIIVAVIAIASFVVCMLLYFDNNTWDFPVWVVALLSAIYLVLYYIFNKKRIHARKEHEVDFWGEVKKDVSFDMNTDNLFAEQMEKKWEKKNKKLLKKGKPAMTRAEILDAEETACRKTEKEQWLNWFVPIPIVAVAVMLIEFETKTDMYWFMGILFIVEYVLMALLWKAAKHGLVDRRKWIEAERRKLENRD